MKPDLNGFAKFTFLFVVLISCGPGYKTAHQGDESSQASTEGLIPMGDMLLSEDSLSGYSPAAAGEDFRPEAFTGIGYASKAWKNGEIPIKFEGNISDEMKETFFRACMEWSKLAKVKCKSKGLFDRDYLHVYPTLDEWDHCSSTVGINQKGKDQMHLAVDVGCWTSSIIIHELGHAFGMKHEHQRPDRDRYIRIVSQNIPEGYEFAYAVVNNGRILGDYDFRSIMHYSELSDTPIEQRVILTQPGYEEFNDSIGSSYTPSELDGQGMAQIYGNQTPAEAENIAWRKNDFYLTAVLKFGIMRNTPVYPADDAIRKAIFEKGFRGLLEQADRLAKGNDFKNVARSESSDETVERLYKSLLGQFDPVPSPAHLRLGREGKFPQIIREILSTEEFKSSVF